MLKHYLYRHIRLDKNEPFYIGIGTKRSDSSFYSISCEYERAYANGKRNNIWQNIAKKTKYKIDILQESDDYDLIKKSEIYFINLYKTIKDGGILANIRKDNNYCKPTYDFKLRPKLNNKYWLGKKRSNETKEKLSHIGKMQDNKMFCKKVICLDDGAIYNSITDAAKINNVSISTISKCCRGIVKRVKNKTFKFFNSQIQKKSKTGRRVVKVDTNEVYESIKDAAIENSCSYTGILDCCIGRQNNVKSKEGKVKFKYL